jgi:hypothetical protein
MMGTWSGAVDAYDSADAVIPTTGNDGYVGIWHEQAALGWTGPTGFYGYDMRAPMNPGEQKTWSRLYLWADPSYTGATMSLAVSANVFQMPPAGWQYTLELVGVPKDIYYPPGAPHAWAVPLDRELRVPVLTYATTSPLDAYEFRFTVNAVPEPAGLLLGGVGAARGRGGRG